MAVFEQRMIQAIDFELNEMTIVEDNGSEGGNGLVIFRIEMQSKKTARIQLSMDEAYTLSKLLATFCEQRRVK